MNLTADWFNGYIKIQHKIKSFLFLQFEGFTVTAGIKCFLANRPFDLQQMCNVSQIVTVVFIRDFYVD